MVLSRNDDTGWGGCIDERARAANASGADLAVSIHADSAPAGDRGFHLIVPALPIPDAAANDAQSDGGLALSRSMRDAYTRSGFSPANYAGVVDGLQTRADIAGPALTTVPLAFVEMGNGGDPEDARTLETGDGQLKHAVAITTGIVGYLLGGDGAAPVAEALPGVADARGVRPGSPATPSSPGTELPSTDRTSPRSSTPSVTTPEAETSPSTPLLSDGDRDGLFAVVTQLLQPLLAELGLGGSQFADGRGDVRAGVRPRERDRRRRHAVGCARGFRRELSRNYRPTHSDRSVGEVLTLPDRYLVLDPFDEFGAGGERLAAVRRSDRGDEGEVADM